MSAKSNAGRIGVWGASGSGKSTYVKRAIKGRKRLIVFDPMEEYAPYVNVTVRSLEEVRQLMARNWHTFKIAYVPPAGKESATLSALSKLLIAAQTPFKITGKGEHITLVVEEMNICFPVHGGAARAKGFADICSRGRHFGIEVYGLSQRIAEVDTRFRGNTTETVILRQQGRNDINAAEQAIGGHKKKIIELRNLSYIHERGGELTEGKLTFK